MKVMKWIFIIVILFLLSGCTAKEKDRVIIYSCLESFRNKEISENLSLEMPQINFTIETLSTGKLAAKLKSEGTRTEGDIVIGLDSAYGENLKEIFLELGDFDNSHYLPEFQIDHKKYLVWERYGGCIVFNREYLNKKNLPIPESYADLLDPIYKNIIVMSDPKFSATGYLFLKNLVNEMGEKGALEYFDELSKNIIFFTASGSGPVNLLIQGEVGIGLGLTFHAVQEINKGLPFEITYFKEGSPYNTSILAMVGKEKMSEKTIAVFDYLYRQGIFTDKELYSPEKIFIDQENKLFNYPPNINYGDMKGVNNIEEKERLLNQWKY